MTIKKIEGKRQPFILSDIATEPIESLPTGNGNGIDVDALPSIKTDRRATARADVNIFPPVAFQAVLSEAEPAAILKTKLEGSQQTQKGQG